MLTNTLLAPVGICLVFVSVTLLNGGSVEEAKTKVKNDMLKTFVTGTLFWPFVSFINFHFIPFDYRPFVGSVAGAIWNVYLSSVANTTTRNSNNTIQLSTGAETTFIAETSEKSMSVLKEIWNFLDHNKKDL